MKNVLIFASITFAAIIVWLIWIGLEANDWIDRCADNSSARYITDEAERRKACKLNPR